MQPQNESKKIKSLYFDFIVNYQNWLNASPPLRCTTQTLVTFCWFLAFEMMTWHPKKWYLLITFQISAFHPQLFCNIISESRKYQYRNDRLQPSGIGFLNNDCVTLDSSNRHYDYDAFFIPTYPKLNF